jgi:aspartokinase
LETVAVYWEPKIKTYGFNEVLELAHINLTIDKEDISSIGLGVFGMADSDNRVLLSVGYYLDDRQFGISLVIKRRWEKKVLEGLQGIKGMESNPQIRVDSPVGLIYFQGPHFGDRYGIADSAFNALTQKGIEVLAAGCSASSIYLVLSEEVMEKAKKSLMDAFLLPVA